MYNWAMDIWAMSSSDFVWVFLKWGAVTYLAWNCHIEVTMWRTRRIARSVTRRMR